MADSLVAINIVQGKEILNKRGIPLLFYWNGKTDIVEDLKNSDDFKNFLISAGPLKSVMSYLKTNISFFYFTYKEDGSDDYKDRTISVQNLYDIVNYKELMNSIIEKTLNYLYNLSFGTTINFTSMSYKSASEAIMNKYKDGLLKTTFIESIRGNIQQNYPTLYSKNIDAVMDYFCNLIK